MTFQLKHIPAANDTVDREWLILRNDGTQTDISIQDCRSYGGAFAVNRHGGGRDDMWVEYLGEAKSLKAAFALACEKAA